MGDLEDRRRIVALISIATLAAQFVTEPESWPVFKVWLAKQGLHMDPEYSRVIAREQADQLLRTIDHIPAHHLGTDGGGG